MGRYAAAFGTSGQTIAALLRYHKYWTGVLSMTGVPSMCDYSLELIASRPAKVGDKLISTDFARTITRGFASVDDPTVAVCLLPGTELAFESEVRRESQLGFSRGVGHSVARFRQVESSRASHHRDALEFPDGNFVLLTHLCKGQLATVLQLPAKANPQPKLAPQKLSVE
jgi:hypothetical protein